MAPANDTSAGEPGDETWGGVPFEERVHVGTWMPPSYDPELRLIYQGTSVTSPAPKFMLGGVDNEHLYHNSTLALDVDTGEIRWYYQHLNDHWDLDHPFERLLLDTAVTPNPNAVAWINPRLRPGEVRKVMTGIPGKTGLVYTLDRETGEFLWATPTIAQNVISDINGATGEVTENSEVISAQRVSKSWPVQHARREGLGSGRLQPANEHDVYAVAQHVPASAGDDLAPTPHTESTRCRFGTSSRPAPTSLVRCMRYRPKPVRPPGSTNSGRRPCRWSRPVAGSSLAAMQTDGSRPSTTRPVRCCGRSTSALR